MRESQWRLASPGKGQQDTAPTLRVESDNVSSSSSDAQKPSPGPTIRRAALLHTLFWLGLAFAQHANAHPSQSAASKTPSASTASTTTRQQSVDLVSSREDLLSLDDATAATNKNENSVLESSSSGHDLEISMDEIVNDDDDDNEELRDNDDDVIVVVAVDGTLAGLSKTSGDLLWKTSGHAPTATSSTEQKGFRPTSGIKSRSGGSKDETTFNANKELESESPIMDPLLSTTTTTKSSSNEWKTAAVPGIDGRVYLTAAGVTVSTNAKDLVERSPFLDSRGRFYVGSRHASAAAIDGDTGELLRTVSSSGDNPPSILSEQDWDGRNVVWIGRVDHSISIHEARTGSVDVQFSIAEIMSVADMVIDAGKETWKPTSRKKSENQQTRHPKQNDRENVQHDMPGGPFFSGDDNDGEQTSLERPFSTSTTAAGSSGAATLIATPNGNIAYRNSRTGEVEWVACESFSTPIAFAIEASTGLPLDVDMIQDVMVQNSSIEYMANQIGRQWEEANIRDEKEEHTIVGALQNSQLFALPLGKRAPTPHKQSLATGVGQSRIEITQQHAVTSSSTAAASNSNTNKPVTKVPPLGGRQHSRSLHDIKQQSPEGKKIATRKACNPSLPNFPACLVGTDHRYEHFARNPEGTFLSETAPNFQGALSLMDNRLHRALANYNPHFRPGQPIDDDAINLAFQHHQQLYAHSEKKSSFQSGMKLLGSWLAPTIAFIFVFSFELGRRKRQKENEEKNNKMDLHATQLRSISETLMRLGPSQHVIQVSDEVLGFGGQGTVVYRGMLEGRNVAVKRLLKAYIASAEREISLLIESDGHPNVVRYFLKEVRGDFVYLALELCDLSLHDLIATLRGHLAGQSEVNIGKIHPSLKLVLLQIASGVKHIHSLRIVHRDLKPANILLAIANQRKSSPHEDEHNRVYQTFMRCEYVAKISDMGLGKQLVGQSSLGVSTMADSSLRGQPKGGASSVGVGPGSVGWQAPEVMAQRWVSDASMQSEGSNNLPESFPDASPIDATANPRTSRSVDIFSLGCIFHSTLILGCHPFGEWYEREANIMHNRPNIDALAKLSTDGHDLVFAMINRNPKLRPTAREVCEHPFFWENSKRLAFICDLSDRVEADITMGKVSGLNCSSAFVDNPLVLERGATEVVGTAWDYCLDDALIANVQKFRTYDPSSVRDLLRLIRNKLHHFDELPVEFRDRLSESSAGLLGYFEQLFPQLLMHCYDACRRLLPPDDPLAAKYCITTPRTTSAARRERIGVLKKRGSDISEGQSPPKILEVNAAEETEDEVSIAAVDDSSNIVNTDDDDDAGAHVTAANADVRISPDISLEEAPVVSIEGQQLLEDSGDCQKVNLNTFDDELEVELSLAMNKQNENCTAPSELDGDTHNQDEARVSVHQTEPLVVDKQPPALLPEEVNDIVIWEGSTAAKTFGCRGWIRSDDEWTRRATLQKRDPVLVRCADDPKFRTRLCNHWDVNLGTFCPMQRKQKCVFAHGPVELRVKEAKRKRWGKLVDKNGNNSNPCHSGGEDTYGAARSIESVRKVEGKWKTGNKNGKSAPKGKNKTANSNNSNTDGSGNTSTSTNNPGNAKKKQQQPTSKPEQVKEVELAINE